MLYSVLKTPREDMWDNLDEFVEHPLGLREKENVRCLRCDGTGEIRIPDGPHGVKIVLCSCKVPDNCDNPMHNNDPW